MKEKEKVKLVEVDLYKPIHTFFTKEGYEVYGEVKNCDMAAIKDDELIIIELKLQLNVELLIQATKRQRLTDNVYIAIPKPQVNLRSKRWTDICHLIRRLELGLITVSFSGNRKNVQVIFHPTVYDRKKIIRQNQRKKERLLTEINGRSADYNIGGSNRTKIMTAYKENCVQIATYLNQFGELSPKKLKEMGTGNKTSSILTKNFYQWFHKVKRGVYQISEKGQQELVEYPELVDYYLVKLKGVSDGKF